MYVMTAIYIKKTGTSSAAKPNTQNKAERSVFQRFTLCTNIRKTKNTDSEPKIITLVFGDSIGSES